MKKLVIVAALFLCATVTYGGERSHRDIPRAVRARSVVEKIVTLPIRALKKLAGCAGGC